MKKRWKAPFSTGAFPRKGRLPSSFHLISVPLTILFSSAGRRVELLNCFRRAAADLDVRLRVLATDANPFLSAACRVADKAIQVPRCDTPEFMPALIRVCAEERVTILVPTIDPELEPLAAESKGLQASGTVVSISSREVVSLARNKLATQRFLSGLDIRTPRTDTLNAFIESPTEWRFPVVIKPLAGSSSVGVTRIDSFAEFPSSAVRSEDYIVQEHWAGDEYTVNLFFDEIGLRCAVPHLRLEVRAGEVSKAVTRRVPVLERFAEKMGAALKGKAFGALCFQAIVTNSGEAAIFELNARFGGGYPLADRAGAPFAKWLLEIALGYPCSAHNNWCAGQLMLRYDAAVFEDTEPVCRQPDH